MRKVAFLTLGCKVNQSDSAAMEQLFRDAGYAVVDFTASADVYVVNTCVVTDIAEKKSRQMIRRAVRQNSGALVVVTGCYPQTAAEEAKRIKGVDLIVGTERRREIVSLLEGVRRPFCADAVQELSPAADFEELPAGNLGTRTRAYLKIQEGCNQYCSYCVIPRARGRVRSRALDSVRSEAARLVESGFPEIVLIGIHLGAYGAEKDAGGKLGDAVKAVLSVAGLKRLRIGSLESTELDAGLIALWQGDRRLCRHLHLPLQAGCDFILRSMKRPYDKAGFQRAIADLRRRVPDLAITTDVIVGFPGETPAMFDETCAFVEQMAFSRVHIFPFSPRAGAPAADFPDQVDREEKSRRAKELARVAQKTEKAFLSNLLGQERLALFEQADGESLMAGLTDDYVKVFAPLDKTLIGKIARVKITGFRAGGAAVEIVGLS